jgi:hypothetical protein
MATLKRCYAAFGVPSWAKGAEWEGNNILFIKINISQSPAPQAEPGEHWTYTAELRNTHIGAGGLLYLEVPIQGTVMDKIEHDYVDLITWKPSAHPGKGSSDHHICKCRSQIVLEFNDGKRIVSGYNDPVDAIVNDRQEHIVHQTFRKEFLSQPTLLPPVG